MIVAIIGFLRPGFFIAVLVALARELLGIELALVLVLLGAVLVAEVVCLAIALERTLVLALARLVQALATVV